MNTTQFRVWNIVNPPSDPVYYPVRNPTHARLLIDALADSQIMDDRIVTNAFGLEEFVNGAWDEWMSVNGRWIGETMPKKRNVIR